MIFSPHNQPTEVVKPSKETFDFPSADVTTQRADVLGLDPPIGAIGSDHFNPVGFLKFAVEGIAVVSLVAYQAPKYLLHPHFFERGFDQAYFSRRSAFCPSGDRKAMPFENCHELCSLAPLGLSDLKPSFFAGTKVPSMKHSLRSNWPRSRRASARLTRSFSNSPCFTQC